MEAKMKKFITRFLEKGLQAYLVVNPVNITYLTDFPSSDAWLIVTANRSYYMTDARYETEVKKNLSRHFKVVCHKNGLSDAFLSLMARAGIKKVGFNPRHISYAQYQKITKARPRGFRLVECDGLVELNRQIKGADEIKKIKQALAIHKKVHRYLKRIITPGLTEKDIAARLQAYVCHQKCGLSFPPIIASGPNTSYPHAQVSNRKLRRKDLCLVDYGIELNGYKSDLTRMFFLGKITDKIYRCYKIVKEAQKLAIDRISAGICVASVDQQARNYLKNNGLDKYFTHALGHGIGLDVHESPSISQKTPGLFKEGMVVTVEPGIYIPHEFGIRVEEMVLVKKQGCEVLSDDIN